ncbi:sulfate adenylyltransferase subunit 1 [Roseivirga thermotolerans]|uniref:sulfate adenylyltransferase subunit 1 n=1 Tax=Roseivirga thermotolerans TaxID=1758176 RepID=UPI00273E575D|nr:GTP-binding protein [Roseivirga thermotolerans]
MENSYLDMELLRFTTAGSVDDGKSTLIGRLLYDSKSIFEDQLEHVANSSKRRGLDHTDLALLTDGLKDEREQGITIDVAYRYFATPKRKFIIADTPGHIQYTRNMVTGASTANVALILIDARKGLVEQTFRHSYIASLLQIPHLVVCINKMDLVNYDEEIFRSIQSEYARFASKLNVKGISFIPISALHGDNVVNSSENMPWYEERTLLSTLEQIDVSKTTSAAVRFPVQTVIRPKNDTYHDYRGYAGRVAGGQLAVGDSVVVLPSGETSTVKQIHLMDEELSVASTGMSVVVSLADDIDVSRGDMITGITGSPKLQQDIEATLCWFSRKGPQPRSKYTLMHSNNEVKAIVKNLNFKYDVNSLTREGVDTVSVNDIINVTLRTNKPLITDKYAENRTTGALILVDENTNETVAAGIIC